MPRTLKRRSELISGGGDGDISASESSIAGPSNRRATAARTGTTISEPSISSSSSVASTPDPEDTQDPTSTPLNAQAESRSSNIQVLIKKLVRLSLSTEYARLPLRRSDITQKILKENSVSHKLFKPVFAGAQEVLRHTFGMTLLELPSKEKTSLKDRRTQVTQTQTQTQQQQKQNTKSQQPSTTASNNKSWILISILPDAYKQNSMICTPARAPTQETESEYTALYTFILSLIYLNNSVLTDAKLERYLKRVNADTYVSSLGPMDKILARMTREGYIEKKRDVSSGEEVVEWTVGPRGKVEVGVRGVADLVKGVYGFGLKNGGVAEGDDDDNNNDNDGEQEDGRENGGARSQGNRELKIEEDDLNARLERSLGLKMSNGRAARTEREGSVETNGVRSNAERPRKGRRRKQNNGDDDDDDDDDE